MKKITRKKILLIFVIGLMLMMNIRSTDASVHTWLIYVDWIDDLELDIEITGERSQLVSGYYSYDFSLSVYDIGANDYIYDITIRIYYEGHTREYIYWDGPLDQGETVTTTIYLHYVPSYGMVDLVFDLECMGERFFFDEFYESGERLAGSVYPVIDSPVLITFGSLNDNTPDFNWNDVDYADQYQVQVDDSDIFDSPLIDYNTGHSYYTPTTISDDYYYWRVRAMDLDNNYGAWSTVDGFEIDTQAPVIALLSPLQDEKINDPTVFLNWSSDITASSYLLEIDDVSSSFSSPFISTVTSLTNYTTIPLPDEIYYWRVQGTDYAGNIGEWFSSNFTLDTDLPTVTLNSPSDDYTTNDTTLYLNWDVSEPSSNYDILVDDDPEFTAPIISVSTIDQFYTTDPLSDGNYYWAVRAVDIAGNIGSFANYRAFIVDTVAPTISLTSPTDGYMTDETEIYLDWISSEDPSVYEIQISNSNSFENLLIDTTTDDTDFTFSTSIGDYYWRIRGTDPTGNVGEWSEIWSFEINTESSETTSTPTDTSTSETTTSTPTDTSTSDTITTDDNVGSDFILLTFSSFLVIAIVWNRRIK